MHKIKKGIKKKVKGKKNKDSEIFTPEEYDEWYKKQKEESARNQQEQLQEDRIAEHSEEDHLEEEHSEDPSSKEHLSEASSVVTDNKENTDWRNFFSATDTVLKKTSENLEHIKESSYFRAKKVQEEVVQDTHFQSEGQLASAATCSAPQSKRWVDLDKGGIDDSLEAENCTENGEAITITKAESEEEENKDPKENLKTLVLQPIEDLPIVAAEDYADVFDTTYVDTVESGEIQLYQIPDSPSENNLNEPDPFDTSNVDKVLHIEKQDHLTFSPQNVKARETSSPQKKKKKNLVNLGCAVEVLTGKVETQSVQEHINLLADFDEEKEQSDLKEQKSSNKELENLEEPQTEKCALDELLFGEELDGVLPEVVIPPKPFELLEEKKSSEKEDSKEEDESKKEELTNLLDPLATTETPLSTQKDLYLKDLVAEFDIIDKVEANSLPLVLKSDAIDDNIKDEIDAEFAALAAESLAKEKEKEIDGIGVVDDNDPFDTSAVSKVLGESEIKPQVSKYTEKSPESEKDPFDVDFANQFITDQKQEKPQKPPRPTAPKKKNQTILDQDPFDTSVADNISPPDPFESIHDKISLPESLQPQAADKQSQDCDNFDPFDTSAADNFGKTELKVLEGELLSDISVKEKVEVDSDFDFNPREEEKSNQPPLRPPSPACFVSSGDENPKAPVLAPQTTDTVLDNFDPFDTSFAEKVDIKYLESELLSDSHPKVNLKSKKPPPRPVSPSCTLNSLQSDNSFKQISSIVKKALAEDFDPFDTSIADSSDYINTKETGLSPDNSKNNLDLKLKPLRPASPVCLLATTPVDENPTLKPLEPITLVASEKERDLDPFDTSIAEQFGKTELKVLETELLNEESEEAFNPRNEEIKPARPPPPPRPVSPACLLSGGVEDQQLPPLSPLATSVPAPSEEIDPFDTSIANKFGKAEIEKLESDLLSDLGTKDQTLHTEFFTEALKKPIRPPAPESSLFSSPNQNSSSLQPSSSHSIITEGTIAEEIDPFDTTIAEAFTKTDSISIEDTLLSEGTSISARINFEAANPKSLFDLSPSANSIPVLNPTKETQPEQEKEIDPFDTSIAAKFGKTELKVLESELVDSGTKRILSDDEFDPREEESISAKRKTPQKDAQNLLDSKETVPAVALSPLKASSITLISTQVQIDPFDTSIADNIGPSHQELKLLDRELLEST